MKRTTKKLTGAGLELFLRRFFASYTAIDDNLAKRMSADGARALSSIRVRRMAWLDWRQQSHKTVVTPTSKTFSTPVASAVPRPTETQPVAANLETSASSDENAFDPYAIGLIPTFQREGADGLLQKLSTVSTVENLRKMARSQQISLPAELRGPEIGIDAIRAAIVAAVEKRIADRRAAAG